MKLLIFLVCLSNVLFAATPAINPAKCSSYVVIMNPRNFQDLQEYEKAVQLLLTPGLKVLRQDTYGEKGMMYQIASQHKKSDAVVSALSKIKGVIVSCTTYYKKQPRMTGSN